MSEYDVTLAAMSSHAASRAACAPIQGKVVNTVPSSDPRYNPKYDSIYNHGYGEPGGTQGISCHHSLYPFIERVNTNPFHHPDTEQAIKNVDIQQKQRALERNVRRDKKLIEYGQKSGDTAGVAHYKGILSAHRAKLRELVKDNEFLHRDYSREKVVTGLASDYKGIKLTDSQKCTNLKIKSGDWGTNINEDKQLLHMESSRAPGKSHLFDSENPQELLD